MIRKRVILLGLTLGLILNQFIIYESNKALAANWITISKDEKSFIDIESIDKVVGTFSGRYGHEIYSAWVKILNKGSKDDKELNKYFGKVYWYKKGLIFVDCDRKEFATKSLIYFDLNESPIMQGYFEEDSDYNLSWHSIIPETSGDVLYIAACSQQ